MYLHDKVYAMLPYIWFVAAIWSLFLGHAAIPSSLIFITIGALVFALRKQSKLAIASLLAYTSLSIILKM